jgi:hypothetical protein
VQAGYVRAAGHDRRGPLVGGHCGVDLPQRGRHQGGARGQGQVEQRGVGVRVAAGRGRYHHVPAREPGDRPVEPEPGQVGHSRRGRSVDRLPARVRAAAQTRRAVLRGMQQRTERRGSLGLAECEHLPHPGALGGLDGEFGQRGRGDQQPGPAVLEPGGDVRRVLRRPKRCGQRTGCPYRLHGHHVAGRVVDEDPHRVRLAQAPRRQSAHGRADRLRELRPRDHPEVCPARQQGADQVHGARGRRRVGVDEGSRVSGLVR